jgi:hypothetical protein
MIKEMTKKIPQLLNKQIMIILLGCLLLPMTSFAAEKLPITVWKNPGCMCCDAWAKHLEENGFSVKIESTGNTEVRKAAGLSDQYGSCHTAKINGYVIEGHVPAKEIKRLLKEKPKAVGLAVPGMPVGSPGMENGNQITPYNVLLVKPNGQSEVYQSYP